MTAAVAVSVTVALFLLAFALWAAHDRLVRRRLKERVVVTLKSGSTFRGILRDVDTRSLLLRESEALSATNGQVVPVDGELIISRGDVDYMQRP